MTRTSMLWCAAVALLVSALAGCGAPAEIPAGEWVGRGTYVDYEGVLPAGGGAPKERSRSRAYETTLKIARTRAFGREAITFDILSKRGRLLNVGDEETEIDGVLVKLRTLPSGAALYAGLDAGVLDSPGAAAEEPVALPPKTLARAVSFPTPDALVLQISYGDPAKKDVAGCWVDTFRFRSDRVIKTGAYLSGSESGGERKAVEVWWFEELRPAR